MIKFFIGFIVLAAVSFIAVWGLADLTYKKGKKERAKQEDQKWKDRWEKDIARHLVLNDPGAEEFILYDGSAMEVPRISFKRFLNLYSISPEKWIITTNEYAVNHNFPFYIHTIKENDGYISKQTAIPLYWESPDDLEEYYNWVEEQFEKGDAALYQNARDKSLKQLTQYIQEDLQQKRKQFEEEVKTLEEQTKQDLEKLNEKKAIELTLDPPVTKSSTSANYNLFYQGYKITNPHELQQLSLDKEEWDKFLAIGGV